MSVFSIAPYFPFRRIKIVKQSILPDTSETRISVEPNRRFHPICHCCGKKVTATHSWTQRTIRDLNLAATRVWVTHRLALYIHQLSQFMTVSEVAKHVKLDWKTVKNIDKMHSQADQIPRKKGTG